METVSCKKSTIKREFKFVHVILPKLWGPWTYRGAVQQDSVRYVMKNTALSDRRNIEILLGDWELLHQYVE